MNTNNQFSMSDLVGEADDLLMIIELEDRLELAAAGDGGRCDRCNGEQPKEPTPAPEIVTT